LGILSPYILLGKRDMKSTQFATYVGYGLQGCFDNICRHIKCPLVNHIGQNYHVHSNFLDQEIVGQNLVNSPTDAF